MRLRKFNNTWVWDGDYTTRFIPKNAGFKWEPDEGYWYTEYIETAAALREYAKDDTREELELYHKYRKDSYNDSIATHSDLDIPAPDGIDYYGYQKAGIEYAYNRKKVLNADAMGTGKTIQSIGLINLLQDATKILIVCPASLKLNWKKEVDRWLVRDLKHQVLYSTDKNTPIETDIYIVNYNILYKLRWLKDISFDLIIGDEAHYIKNKSSKRSKYFRAMARKVDRLLLLTGTPIMNKPIELYPLIELLGFRMNYMSYAKRYCAAFKGRFGWDMSGASNMEELQSRLRETCMIRRTKEQVLPELPAKTRQIIDLDAGKYKPYLDEEYAMVMSHGWMDVSTDVGYEERVLSMIGMEPTDAAELAKIRKELAVAKVDDVVAHVNELLENVDKVIVFAHHRKVIEGLQEKFGDIAVKLYGGMTEAQKNGVVEMFQNDKDVRVFVGSITAAGVGLTLTAASVVVFAELDWVPANVTQAEDRAHRIGQQDNVLVHHMVVDGSIDALISKSIIAKQDVIDRAMNVERMKSYKDTQRQSIIDAAKKTEESRSEILQELEKQREKKEKQLEIARDKANKRRLGEIRDSVPEYTNEERKAIHDQIFAILETGKVDNALDYNIAKSLTRTLILSNRQAKVGEDIIAKYKFLLSKS